MYQIIKNLEKELAQLKELIKRRERFYQMKKQAYKRSYTTVKYFDKTILIEMQAEALEEVIEQLKELA